MHFAPMLKWIPGFWFWSLHPFLTYKGKLSIQRKTKHTKNIATFRRFSALLCCLDTAWMPQFPFSIGRGGYVSWLWRQTHYSRELSRNQPNKGETIYEEILTYWLFINAKPNHSITFLKETLSLMTSSTCRWLVMMCHGWVDYSLSNTPVNPPLMLTNHWIFLSSCMLFKSNCLAVFTVSTG